jgi:hypothetical protein
MQDYTHGKIIDERIDPRKADRIPKEEKRLRRLVAKVLQHEFSQPQPGLVHLLGNDITEAMYGVLRGKVEYVATHQGTR